MQNEYSDSLTAVCMQNEYSDSLTAVCYCFDAPASALEFLAPAAASAVQCVYPS